MQGSAFRIPVVKEFPYKDLWPVDQYSVSVLPDWLFKYLTNKGLAGDYLLSDIVLDQNLSTEDLAIIMFLNGPDFPGGKNSGTFASYHLRDEIFCRHQSPENFKLNARLNSASDYAYTQNVRDDVELRLSGICNETQPSYEFIVTGPKIWLIVKAGFLTMLKDSASRLSFYRDYLSTVGKIAPLRSVAHTAVFSNWVDELVG